MKQETQQINFHQLIESDLADVESLIALLEREKAILSERQFEELPTLVEQKQSKMKCLEENFKRRVDYLTNSHDGDTYLECLNSYINTLAPEQREPIIQLNQQLEQALAKCRDLNTINGQVISVNLNNHAQLMNIIQGKPTQATYDAKGNIQRQAQQTKHQEI
jgi:flagella synthesis protein FlgN